MSKIAIVVQRCHPSIVGGSEALAWQYAGMLRERFDVEILTTTAVDYVDWREVLPAGCERRDGILVRRFPITVTRSRYWHELHARLLSQSPAGANSKADAVCRGRWTIAMQEELLRHQGPYCMELNEFVAAHGSAYAAWIFVTYQYPTTYFAAEQAPPDRRFLVPTLHDEPIAGLDCVRRMARSMRGIIWLTEAEKRLGRRIWGEVPGTSVGMAVASEPVEPANLSTPYLLYCGRIDQPKGCVRLIEDFCRFKRERPSALRLVLTGPSKIEIPQSKEIEYRGLVPDEEKYALMAGASAFVMPSPWESFSIATLEAMAQGTPVIVNGACEVLAEHVALSQAGQAYDDYASFASAVSDLLDQPEEWRRRGVLGRDYVCQRYDYQQVRERLLAALNELDSLPSQAPVVSAFEGR